MYSIKVRENILIAHSLPGEVFGPAQNMHGATYLVDAEFFTDKLNKYNIILEVLLLKCFLKCRKVFEAYLTPRRVIGGNYRILNLYFIFLDLISSISLSNDC